MEPERNKADQPVVYERDRITKAMREDRMDTDLKIGLTLLGVSVTLLLFLGCMGLRDGFDDVVLQDMIHSLPFMLFVAVPAAGAAVCLTFYMLYALDVIPKEHRPEREEMWFFLLAVMALLIAVPVHNMLEEKRDIREKAALREEFFEMRGSFGKDVHDWFGEHNPYGDFPYVGTSRANGNISVTDGRWKEYILVTLEADDSFDRLSDVRQSELLEEAIRLGKDVLREMKQSDEFAAYRKFSNTSLSFLGSNYSLGSETNFMIRTSENKYESNGMISGYFVKNGKDHFTEKGYKDFFGKKETPTPAPSSGRKYGTGGTYGKTYIYNDGDDYNAEDYDDPEDFWEENRDVFEDYDDAADYWEEYYAEHGG